jgi:ribose transport system ATP-binding protein
MGENGAGKSTLMKILGGAEVPDAGEIVLEGIPVSVPTVAAAKALGIAFLHQELILAPNIDVTANIFLGSEHCTTLTGRLDRDRMESEAALLLRKVGLEISPRTVTRTLTTGQLQMIEICKALQQQARLLVMDEPTASLSLKETERLLAIIAELRAAGIGILYVSHRMEEVFRVADRILVLRDGCKVGECAITETDPQQVVSMMVGHALGSGFRKRGYSLGEPVLEIRNLVVRGSLAGVSFYVRRGEILGFAGLVGSGRTELMRVIAGVERATSGEMLFDSQAYAPGCVTEAIRRGVCLVPEDRKHDGLVLSMSIAANISLPDLQNYRPRWRFDFRREQQVALQSVHELQIRPPAVDRAVGDLSGGNQQKVVLAKWLAMKPRLLILDEPTRGIDVAARAEIHARVLGLADRGLTVLLVSSDLEEILGLSDRVVVMRNNCISGIVPYDEISKERIGVFMTAAGRAT